MLSLFVISMLVSIAIGTLSVKLYRTVRDKDLGHEEIISVSILIGACINICIEIINILSYPSPAFMNAKIGVASRLMADLISYSVIQYMFQMHEFRLGTREK